MQVNSTNNHKKTDGELKERVGLNENGLGVKIKGVVSIEGGKVGGPHMTDGVLTQNGHSMFSHFLEPVRP